MPVGPEGARQSTLNINAIHGGLAEDRAGLPAPLVPDSCRLVLDRRYLIEEDPEAVKREIVDLLDGLKQDRKGFDYALREVLAFQPTMTDPEAPVVRAVSAAIEAEIGRAACRERVCRSV